MSLANEQEKTIQKQDDIEKTIKILEEQTANIDVTDRLLKCMVRVGKEKKGA